MESGLEVRFFSRFLRFRSTLKLMEEKYVGRVYETVTKSYNGDPGVVFPGGLSMGGLARGRFVLRKSTIKRYRAVRMFGAAFERPHPRIKWLKDTPFFLAVGAKDFNRRAAQSTLPRLKRIAKSVEYHVMPGVAHQVDFKNYGPKLPVLFKRNLLAEQPAPVAEKKGAEGRGDKGP
jgi:hypothetical protein